MVPWSLRYRRLLCVIFLLLGISLEAISATTGPGVQAELPAGLIRNYLSPGSGQEEMTWQGQRSGFVIELLSRGRFSGVPDFQLPASPLYLIAQSQKRPIQGTPMINGSSYVSQLYEFWLVSNQAGQLTIPAFPVRFTVVTPDGQGDLKVELLTEPLQLSFQSIPDEAAAARFSSRQFSMTETWTGASEEVKVGDSLTRTITMKSIDLPSIFLPQLTFSPPPSVALYQATPELVDSNERGESSGSRRESLSYVFEQEGEIAFQAIRLSWWNVAKRKLETEILQPRKIKVAANPLFESEKGGSGPHFSRSSILFVLSGIVCLVAVGCWWLLKGSFVRRWRTMIDEYKHSEPVVFRSLCRALSQNKVSLSYSLLLRWYALADGKVVRETMDPVGRQLLEEVARLDRSLFGKESGQSSNNREKWRGQKLRLALKNYRRLLLKRAILPGGNGYLSLKGLWSG